MKTGDIVLIPFPFAEGTQSKVRPAVAVAETKDRFKDLIVAAISSVVPDKLSANEIMLLPDSINKLRAKSVIKVDRLVTIKSENIIAHLSKLSSKEIDIFKTKFRNLVNGK